MEPYNNYLSDIGDFFKRGYTLFAVLFLLIITLSLSANRAYAVTSTINSIAAGNWSTASNWSTGVVPDADDFVNINNAVNLDANLAPAAGATYTFYANSSGAATLNTSNGAVIDIRANVTFSGTGNNLNGGTIYVRSGYTLTLADIATANAATSIVVESGATLVILGDFLDNHGTMTIDGTLTVNGNYDGQASDATIVGAGNFTTGGHLIGINGSSVFGVVNPSCSGPCDGRNLCTAYTVSVSPVTTTICGAGAQTLTATVSAGTPSYQWQSSSTGAAGSFTDIFLATGSSLLAITASKTYYRVRITETACTKYSNTVSVTYGLSAPSASAITGTTTVCQGSVQTYSTSSLLATDYSWTVPSGSIITSGAGTNTIIVTIGSTGGNITVTPINGCGSGSVVSKAITVNTLTPGAISTTAASVCQSTTGKVYSISSVTGASGYNWTVPSGATITAGTNTASITVSFGSSAVSGYVTVTPTNACGSSITSSAQYVTVTNAIPAAASITGPTSVCKEQTAVSYSIPAGTGATSYSYALPTGVTITSGSGTNAVVASFAAASVSSGTFSINGINACGTRTNSITVTIGTGCAESWIGVTSTDWNTATNWSLGFIPTSINSVTIPSGTPYVAAVTAASNAAGITINSGATVTISAAGILNVYGNIANSGTLTPASGSTIAFKGSSAQTINGVPTLYNVQINNTSGGVAISSALLVKGAMSLLSGVLTTNSNLTINFDNGGNIKYNSGDLGSISGNVTGTRSLTAHTHYIAAPFSGVTSAQVQATTPLYVSPYWKMYTKTFATQGWAAVTDVSTSMPLGTGFSLSLPSAASLTFTGTYNHSFTLTGATYSNAVGGKYILVGNPYPSTLDWSLIYGSTTTNVGGAIYYWGSATNQVSSWVSGVGSGNPTGTPYIPSMQAFMVTTVGTTGNSSVSINNGARTSLQNPSYLRTASVDEIIRIKLQSEDSTQWDDAVIRYNEMATIDFDAHLDAYKLLNTTSPSIYTKAGDTIYAINSVAEPLSSIPVSVKLLSDGNYILSVYNSDASSEYVLIDKKLGTKNLLTGSSYKFSGLKSDDADRFELQLQYRSATTTNILSSSSASGLQINSSTKGFVIQTQQFAGSDASIELLDVTGKIIKTISDKTLSNGSTYVPVDIAEGAYVVKVVVDNNIFAQLVSLTK